MTESNILTSSEASSKLKLEPAPALTRLPTVSITLDAFIPPEMAAKAEDVGVNKATMGLRNTFFLSIMAGQFISLGAIFATTVAAGAGGQLTFGITRLLTGLVFCLGLILVVVAGAELFTGNNLIVMAMANRRISTLQVLRNWIIVYVGNFVGSISVVFLALFGPTSPNISPSVMLRSSTGLVCCLSF